MSQTETTSAPRGRVTQILQNLIAPHSSVQDQSEYRRAWLLSTFTLILTVLFFSALFFSPKNPGTVIAQGCVSLVAYILSRTKYYRFGAYLFTYAITSIAFWGIYRGTVTSIDTTISTTIHIALILSSILLSPGGFLILAILVTIATFTAPQYTNLPILRNENIVLTSGVVFVISAVLYFISLYRTRLDRTYSTEMDNVNRNIENIKVGFEKRLAARALESQESSRQAQNYFSRLRTISELSQVISTNAFKNLDEFLAIVAGSISEKLSFYHVGIFLLNESRQYAVLHAANSEGGMQMLAHHHQLKVGGTGIVGYAAQGGLPRIALDTGTDAVFFNNPDLPKTHSEMALPLKIGSQTIGVLDVQSEQPSAFSDEDSFILGGITHQIAIVINSSRLHEGSQSAFPTQQADRQSVQFTRKNKKEGFSYLPDGTLSSTTTSIQNSPVFEKTIASGETVVTSPSTTGSSPTLAVPVKLRDQVIGIIHIEAADQNRKWTEEEITMVQSISERVALALENARLFEETARRAEQERVVAQVTSHIGESNDMDRILHTTIQELGRLFGTSRTFIQLTGTQKDADPGITVVDDRD